MSPCLRTGWLLLVPNSDQSAQAMTAGLHAEQSSTVHCHAAGENVYAIEVEAVIAGIPAVKQARTLKFVSFGRPSYPAGTPKLFLARWAATCHACKG